jgi:hypothetical protein
MQHETMAREAFPLADMDSAEISVTLLLGEINTKSSHSTIDSRSDSCWIGRVLRNIQDEIQNFVFGVH